MKGNVSTCYMYCQVGFTKDGKITAVECDVYNNAGHSLDLSGAGSNPPPPPPTHPPTQIGVILLYFSHTMKEDNLAP